MTLSVCLLVIVRYPHLGYWNLGTPFVDIHRVSSIADACPASSHCCCCSPQTRKREQPLRHHITTNIPGLTLSELDRVIRQPPLDYYQPPVSHSHPAGGIFSAFRTSHSGPLPCSRNSPSYPRSRLRRCQGSGSAERSRNPETHVSCVRTRGIDIGLECLPDRDGPKTHTAGFVGGAARSGRRGEG